MSKIKFLISSMGCATLLGCSGAMMTSAADRPLDSDYEGYQIQWQGEDASTFVLYNVFEEEGKVALCGAYSFDKQLSGGTESLHRRSLTSMYIELDGERIQDGLGSFRFVPYSTAKQGGGSASCVLTGKVWKDEYADTVRPELKRFKKGFTVYS